MELQLFDILTKPKHRECSPTIAADNCTPQSDEYYFLLIEWISDDHDDSEVFLFIKIFMHFYCMVESFKNITKKKFIFLK